MRTQFINFVTGLNFSRDDMQAIQDDSLFKEMLSGDTRTAPAKMWPVTVPVKWAPIVRNGVWEMVNSRELSAALPHRFSVFMRLRMRNSAKPSRGEWESVRMECLLDAFGIIVNLRFGFGNIPADQLAVWPGTAELSLMDSSGAEIWHGGIAGLCFRAIETVLGALGDGWMTMDRSTWADSLERAVFRVYTEIRPSGQALPDKRLMYGLAVHKPGWQEVSREQFRNTFSGQALKEGESSLFATRGCALMLTAANDAQQPAAWMAANCRRRNITYAQALHQIITDHLWTLSQELSQVEGLAKPEFDYIRSSDTASLLSQARYALMVKLQAKYPHLKYYAKKKGVDEWLGDLPEHDRSRVMAKPVWEKLVKQLSAL